LVLFTELDGGKALLDHGHERLSLPGVERELERRVEARAVESGLSRREDEASRAFDHLERVPVPVELEARGSEVDCPYASDA
jgi:hypothetical protein